MKTIKKYEVSSYGVIFAIEVEASHSDCFLNKFLDEELEGGGILFSCLADHQCNSTMEGKLPDDCFLYNDNGNDRDLIKEYGIHIKFRAIDLECCNWLEVKHKHK